jgi:hypothetical protein
MLKKLFGGIGNLRNEEARHCFDLRGDYTYSSDRRIGIRILMDPLSRIVQDWEVRQLHNELASLYRTKSRDYKRIQLLWDAIERKEAVMILEGKDPR